MSAKILLLDIETAPAVVYTWGLYDQNIGINQIIHDGYVLCWAAKWLGNKSIISDSVYNHRRSHDVRQDYDKQIAKSMWQLLDEADIVVTHNGNNFDLKWLNTVFIKHSLPPPSDYKSIDTYSAMKTYFRFVSNKLDFVSRKLELGHKLNTNGFELWEKCMKGDHVSWAKMVEYCKHDVLLLEKLYLALRPFIKNHPNLALYTSDNKLLCTNCGSGNIQHRGFAFTATSKYRRYVCKDCGKWSRENKSLAKKQKLVNVS